MLHANRAVQKIANIFVYRTDVGYRGMWFGLARYSQTDLQENLQHGLIAEDCNVMTQLFFQNSLFLESGCKPFHIICFLWLLVAWHLFRCLFVLFSAQTMRRTCRTCHIRTSIFSESRLFGWLFLFSMGYAREGLRMMAQQCLPCCWRLFASCRLCSGRILRAIHFCTKQISFLHGYFVLQWSGVLFSQEEAGRLIYPPLDWSFCSS